MTTPNSELDANLRTLHTKNEALCAQLQADRAAVAKQQTDAYEQSQVRFYLVAHQLAV
jgi:predicted secreted Zn-dependent protease